MYADRLTHEPKVTVGGPRKIAIVGLSFSLTCDIAALQTDGNITYEWYRKGLEGCKDEFLRKTEAVLIFSQLQMTNEGGYYCKVSVDGKATRTTDVYRLKPIGIFVYKHYMYSFLTECTVTLSMWSDIHYYDHVLCRVVKANITGYCCKTFHFCRTHPCYKRKFPWSATQREFLSQMYCRGRWWIHEEIQVVQT